MTAWLSLLLATSPVVADAPAACAGPVFQAIEAGDVLSVRRHVTSATIDAPGLGACAKRTPLLAAAEQGQLDVVDALLSLGADVNFTVVEKRGLMKGRVTAECLARANGHDEVAALLKKQGGGDTVDGCRRRAALVAAVRAEDLGRLSKERKAGNRLPVALLGEVLQVTDCSVRPAWCVELARHLPKEPSKARDAALDTLEAWAEIVPELRPPLRGLVRSEP